MCHGCHNRHLSGIPRPDPARELLMLFETVLRSTEFVECTKCRAAGRPSLFTRRGAWLHQVTAHPDTADPEPVLEEAS